MPSVIQPNAWVGLKLPSENVRFLQVVPNTTISLGKYGAFPSNLIIHRPYDLTYELLDKQDDEPFSRLRVIPTDELYADVFADEARAAEAAVASSKGETGDDAEPDADADTAANETDEYTLIDMESQAVIARSNQAAIESDARQTLTNEEILALKREGTGAGRDIIAKLLLSHTALDQKTQFSLAKYKLLKAKKYIRRFTVLPLDVYTLGNWLLDDKDVGAKIMELRDEMVALLGCWGNVHYGGDDRFLPEAESTEATATTTTKKDDISSHLRGGRWLVVDDTGGLLVAAMAERMGILYNHKDEGEAEADEADETDETADAEAVAALEAEIEEAGGDKVPAKRRLDAVEGGRRKKQARSDLDVTFSLTNTMTLLHANSQANLTYLKYFGFDHADPARPAHPLNDHLLPLSWLQLLEPESDSVYAHAPQEASDATMASWKPSRRGAYHRKRRRWVRTRHIVDAARAGGFEGLVMASTLDLASTLRHALPLLASGAPVAIYSPTMEPLAELADLFSIPRRTAWAGPDPPPGVAGKSVDELEHWPGTPEFPVNPMLLLGVQVQTSRARKWQVLPGRTHPLMTARGGAEGYILTGWKAKPAEGRVTARGKFKKRRDA